MNHRSRVLKQIGEKLSQPSSIENVIEVYKAVYPQIDILGARITQAVMDSMRRVLQDLQGRPSSPAKDELLRVIGRFVLYYPEFHDLTYEWWVVHPLEQRLDILLKEQYYLYDNEDFYNRVYLDMEHYLKENKRRIPATLRPKIWRIIVAYQFDDLKPLSGYTKAAPRRS